MANEPGPGQGPSVRNWIALGILLLSALAITVLACVAVQADNSNALTIFNTSLPVFASWVGTVLAFYFGRESFESANSQMRQLISKLSPEERAQAPISNIMRKLNDTVHQLDLKQLRDRLTTTVSRLPVIGPDLAPRLLIHASAIDKYLATGGKDSDSLATFLSSMAKEGMGFEVGQGFVLAAAGETIAAAKARLESLPMCQDILITQQGKSDEPLLGWVSNIRLSKYLQP
jgi:hypothetical protein